MRLAVFYRRDTKYAEIKDEIIQSDKVHFERTTEARRLN